VLNKVLSVQFGIQGPAAGRCPKQATATGWIYTNYLGSVTVTLFREGRSAGMALPVGPPVTLRTVLAPNGQYVATYTSKIAITAPISARYRLVGAGGSGGSLVSDWAPLRATCSTAPQELFGG
jgi:hypothetical protein